MQINKCEKKAVAVNCTLVFFLTSSCHPPCFSFEMDCGFYRWRCCNCCRCCSCCSLDYDASGAEDYPSEDVLSLTAILRQILVNKGENAEVTVTVTLTAVDRYHAFLSSEEPHTFLEVTFVEAGMHGGSPKLHAHYPSRVHGHKWNVQYLPCLAEWEVGIAKTCDEEEQ